MIWGRKTTLLPTDGQTDSDAVAWSADTTAVDRSGPAGGRSKSLGSDGDVYSPCGRGTQQIRFPRQLGVTIRNGYTMGGGLRGHTWSMIMTLHEILSSDCIVKHPLLTREREREMVRSTDHSTAVDFRKSRCQLHAWERLKSVTRQSRDEEHNISDGAMRSGTHTHTHTHTHTRITRWL
jgi:hypothetical protein